MKTKIKDVLVVEEIWLIIFPDKPTITEPIGSALPSFLTIIGELSAIFDVCERFVIRFA